MAIIISQYFFINLLISPLIIKSIFRYIVFIISIFIQFNYIIILNHNKSVKFDFLN